MKIVKNDKRRLYAQCVESEACMWRVHCHKIKDGPGFQVHTYVANHTCGGTVNVKCARSGWLAQRFLHKFKIDPDKRPKVRSEEHTSELSHAQ